MTSAAAAARAAEAPPIRLLIVDDSAVARAVLSRMVTSQAGFEIAATAATADEAIAALRRVQVDIVLLDVEMPGTSGLDALPEILRLGRGARVLVVSSQCEAGAEAAVKALAMGAADTLPKPGAENFAGRFASILAERLRRIGRGDAVDVPVSAREASPPLRAVEPYRLGCLAIGASTGGLHAIAALLGGLPRRVGAPILVTQHLPALFMPFFACQVAAASGRPARVAEEGAELRADHILIAPGDAHLALDQQGSRVRVRLDTAPAASGCLPSVDVMLGAVGEIYGRSGLGVVLTGMGRDGLAGARNLAGRGGALLAQDKGSSAVWGMPGAIAAAGLASRIAPPADLAAFVAERARRPAWS
ncbi:MAG: chemotaxis-specific protein-glutamate methyltransferase CheB [Alphaproteobacteria bacterium]|nr:chemotaxis-specific protein-glutamate methyltransferase CheB [Alphaproteobacteria bacterium]